jgi:para-nitrobenzyl esterase
MRSCACAMLVAGLAAAPVTTAFAELGASTAHPEGSEVIRTRDGLVQGTTDGRVTVYKGIPFAAPPIGDLRWRAPQPPPPWKGVRKVDAFKPMCMTHIPAIPGGQMDPVSEDCLYLNIWTPARRSKSKLPVMVWIYGGGERGGSGSSPLYWGDQLVEKGVITVNLSYRVGTFGFLSHPDLSAESNHGTSGNYGVMDMVAALRWVRQNIGAFGGDPHNVTIFGQSSGSFGVGYMMMSPLARGLFRHAIGESGADMGELRNPKDAEASGVRWAAYLGANSIRELRQLPADQLEAADAKWPADAAGVVPGDGLSGSLAVLDGYVFPNSMYETFQAGMQNDVPILIGYNANEGGDQLPSPLRAVEYVDSIEHDYGDAASTVLSLYPASSDAVAIHSQLALIRDNWYGWQTWSWARLQSTTGHGRVYFYRFSHAPNWPPDYSRLIAMGAAHGFELGYVFAHAQFLPPMASAADKYVMETMSTYWTNFAKFGNPNGPELPIWPAFTSNAQRIMTLGDPIEAGNIPEEDLRGIRFWSDYYADKRSGYSQGGDRGHGTMHRSVLEVEIHRSP